ncbi:MAG: sigma factor-like helix-turn-helix DNA-binding protein [Eubacteriales bacterium]|nr:sigma factor-like helix-turn-helix DNA-binding protein [Eubacteriales bacterium]
MNELAKESLLFDYYGSLLTERQQQVMRLYHEDNFSLSEIAAETGISRNAVYDALKKAERQLAAYEKKLGLVGKFLKKERQIQSIRNRLLLLTESETEENRAKLREILEMLDEAEKE